MKILFGLLLPLILGFVSTVITFLFLYMSWNWGIVPALSFVKPLSLSQAFWLDFGLVMLGNSLKGTSVTMKE
jgi:hypothetical protein